MRLLLDNVSTNVTGDWVDFGTDPQFRNAFDNGANTLYISAGTWDSANVAIEIQSKDGTDVFAVSTLATITENTAAHLGFLSAKIRAVVTGAGVSTAGIQVGIESYSAYS